MRRLLPLILLATPLTVPLAVYAPAVSAVENVTLTFWTFLDPKKNTPREKAWAEIIQAFEKKNPGITVRPEVFPWKEISPKLIVASSAGRGPDVTLVETDLSEKLARGKILEPLDRYIAAGDPRIRDDLYHPETRIVDGQTFSLNMWTNGTALFYRKDLFEKAGLKPPRTVDEFVAAAKTLTVDSRGDGRIDQWGFAEGTARSQPFGQRTLFPLIWAQGGVIVTPDGKAAFNNPAGVKAVQWFVDLVKVQKVMPPDIVNLTYDEHLQGFMAGRYAMIFEGMHRYQNTQTSPVVKGKVGLSYIPSWDGKKPSPTPVTGWDIGIGAYSKQKDAAWKFIMHALSYESQMTNAKIAGQVPARRSVAKDLYFQSADATEIKFVLDYLALGSQEFPRTKNVDRLMDLFNQAINEVLLNDVPVKVALDRAAAKYNEGI